MAYLHTDGTGVQQFHKQPIPHYSKTSTMPNNEFVLKCLLLYCVIISCECRTLTLSRVTLDPVLF